MPTTKIRSIALATAVVLATASAAWAIGFGLGQSKEELKLDYDLEITDHGTGRITAVLTLSDSGRLKPLRAVSLTIPAREETPEGGRHVDFTADLAASEQGGKQIYRVHMLEEWADRAQIRLKTANLDGKETALTWYFYTIAIADHLGDND